MSDDLVKQSVFTDQEAAQRLLDRLCREIAGHIDTENLHSAEDLIKRSAKRYLEQIARKG